MDEKKPFNSKITVFPESILEPAVLTQIAGGLHTPERYYRGEVKKRSREVLTMEEENSICGDLSRFSWEDVCDLYDKLTPYDAMFMVRRVPGLVLSEIFKLPRKMIFSLKKMCNVMGDMSQEEYDLRAGNLGIVPPEEQIPLTHQVIGILRRYQGHTIKGLAWMTNTPEPTVWKYERGVEVPLSDESLRIFAEHLGVTPNTLAWLLRVPEHMREEEVAWRDEVIQTLRKHMPTEENGYHQTLILSGCEQVNVPQHYIDEYTFDRYKVAHSVLEKRDKAEEKEMRAADLNKLRPYLNERQITKIPTGLQPAFCTMPKHMIRMSYSGKGFDKKYNEAVALYGH